MGQITVVADTPVYIGDGGEAFDIKHSGNDARKIIYQRDGKIFPNRYYVLGELKSTDRLVVQFGKGTDTSILWEYEGEFRVVEQGARVSFPSQVRWVRSFSEFEEGYIYIFHVKNLVGRIDRVEI